MKSIVCIDIVCICSRAKSARQKCIFGTSEVHFLHLICYYIILLSVCQPPIAAREHSTLAPLTKPPKRTAVRLSRVAIGRQDKAQGGAAMAAPTAYSWGSHARRPRRRRRRTATRAALDGCCAVCYHPIRGARDAAAGGRLTVTTVITVITYIVLSVCHTQKKGAPNAHLVHLMQSVRVQRSESGECSCAAYMQ